MTLTRIITRVGNAALRPGRTRTARVTFAREVSEVNRQIQAKKRDTKIRQLNAQNQAIVDTVFQSKGTFDVQKALKIRDDLLKDLISLNEEFEQKEKEFSIDSSALRGESTDLSVKDVLDMRDKEVKKAILINHENTLYLIREHFEKGSLMCNILESLLDTRTAHRYSQLYSISYLFLTINDEILKKTHNLPLSDDERLTRINDFAFLRFLLSILIALAILYITETIYAETKRGEIEKRLGTIDRKQGRLQAEVNMIHHSIDELSKRRDDILQEIAEHETRIERLKFGLYDPEKWIDFLKVLLRNPADHGARRYPEIQRNITQLTGAVHVLRKELSSINKELTCHHHIMEHLELKEKLLIEDKKVAERDLNNCGMNRFLLRPHDSLREFQGTFFALPKEVSQESDVSNTIMEQVDAAVPTESRGNPFLG